MSTSSTLETFSNTLKAYGLHARRTLYEGEQSAVFVVTETGPSTLKLIQDLMKSFKASMKQELADKGPLKANSLVVTRICQRQQNEQQKEAWNRETSILALAKSPKIVAFYGSIWVPARGTVPPVTLSLFEVFGARLSDLNLGTITSPEAMFILEQIGAALIYLHEKLAVAHRLIKPQSIVLTADPKNVLKLTNFVEAIPLNKDQLKELKNKTETATHPVIVDSIQLGEMIAVLKANTKDDFLKWNPLEKHEIRFKTSMIELLGAGEKLRTITKVMKNYDAKGAHPGRIVYREVAVAAGPAAGQPSTSAASTSPISIPGQAIPVQPPLGTSPLGTSPLAASHFSTSPTGSIELEELAGISPPGSPVKTGFFPLHGGQLLQVQQPAQPDRPERAQSPHSVADSAYSDSSQASGGTADSDPQHGTRLPPTPLTPTRTSQTSGALTPPTTPERPERSLTPPPPQGYALPLTPPPPAKRGFPAHLGASITPPRPGEMAPETPPPTPEKWSKGKLPQLDLAQSNEAISNLSTSFPLLGLRPVCHDPRFFAGILSQDFLDHFVQKGVITEKRKRDILLYSRIHRSQISVHLAEVNTEAKMKRVFYGTDFLATTDHGNIITFYWAFHQVALAKMKSDGHQQQQQQQQQQQAPSFPSMVYYILEHHGPCLREVVTRADAITFGNIELVSVFKRIGSALIYMHRQGWVHGHIELESVVTYFPGDISKLDQRAFREYPLKLVNFCRARKVKNARAQYATANAYSKRRLGRRGAFLSARQAKSNPFFSDPYYFGLLLKNLALGRGGGNGPQRRLFGPDFASQFLALPLNDFLKRVVHFMARPYSVTMKAAYDELKHKAGFNNF